MKKWVFGIAVGIIFLVVGYIIFLYNYSAHPKIKIDEVQSIKINEKILEWGSSSDKIERFIQLYNRAKNIRKDYATTPSYIIIIKLKNGEEINMQGTNEDYHYVYDGEKEYKISSLDLTYYLKDLMK